MVIYTITNLINGKVYVGQTVQPLHDRWVNHKCDSKTKQTPLYKSMRKHGIDNFLITVIASAATIEELNTLEQRYIIDLDCTVPKGYNLLPGGLNKRHHPETRAKIAEKLKGRPIKNRWTGGNRVAPTPEVREKISGKLRGRPIGHRYTGGNKAPRTAAQKAHLSSLNKGKSNVALHKKVVCVETSVVYESVNAAAAATEVSRATISSLLKTGKVGRNGLSFVLAGVDHD